MATAPATSAESLVGRVLGGKYLVEAALGGGSMGTVYRARQVALERTVAIKVMASALATTPDFVARFHREAKAASRLNHPSSIGVTDFGEEPDGLLYLVMEYVPGRNLDRVIQEEWPLAPSRIASILEQILSAVAAAHDLGIVHRDLKPENVLVVPKIDDEGQPVDVVKVCDFGIATMVGEVDGVRSPAGAATPGGARKLTAVGAILGTPAYMSPEQVQGLAPDARSDLYAIGGILYEMLTQRIPFDLDAPEDLFRAHLLDTPRHPTEVVASSDRALGDLAMRALRKEPEERFASARAMRSAIRRSVAVGGDASGDAPYTPISPQLRVDARDSASMTATPVSSDAMATAPGPLLAKSSAVERRRRETLASTTLPPSAEAPPPVPARSWKPWALAAVAGLLAVGGGLAARPSAQPAPLPVVSAVTSGAMGTSATPKTESTESAPAAPGVAKGAPVAVTPEATASARPAPRATAPAAPTVSSTSAARVAAPPSPAVPVVTAEPVPVMPPPVASAAPAAPPPEPAAAAPAAPAYSPDRAKVSVTITSVNGTPRSALVALLAHVTFTPCYATVLRALGRPEGGRATMHLDVDEDGVVTTATARLPPPLASASSCFSGRIQRQRLPSAPDTGTASAELALELVP